MMGKNRYSLVHLCTSGDYKIPLVASQLFDQAQWQAVIKEEDAPNKVSVWAIESMREVFRSSSKLQIQKLKTRCPGIEIGIVGGVGRLKTFPVFEILKYKRKKLGIGSPVIYHCRSESVIEWAIKLKQHFPQDKILLDVRGYWPDEMLYKKGIYANTNLSEIDFFHYKKALGRLVNAIKNADGITTVSGNLRSLLIKEAQAPKETYVVPCCIATIEEDSKREQIRQNWGIRKDEKVVIYSGGIAKYQHLQDLTFPFVKKLMDLTPHIRLVLLTSETEGMKKLLKDSDLDLSRTIIDSAEQQEVAVKLTGADVGLLIRVPTIVNQVAHPVKINEYLASGLSIIAEDGMGGISSELIEQGAAKLIHTTRPDYNEGLELSDVNKWINSLSEINRKIARELVKKNYLWKTAIKIHRKEYQRLLSVHSNN